jgi:AraC-like DNA-binding protein
MANIKSPFPIWQCPIEEITGIWLANIPSFHTNLTKVPPDHNLQLVLSGQYRLRINDQEYHVLPGSMIYYYKGEDVHWLENDEPVSFYSYVFKGANIQPLPLHQRIVPASVEMAMEFRNIHQAALDSFSNLNQIQVYCGMLRILKEMNFHFIDQTPISEKNLWRQVENKLIEEQNYRPQMSELIKLSGYSRATLYRNCQELYGLAPAQRFRDLRMEKAKFLLLYTPMSITQIASYLRYPRVHEFSREFAFVVGETPSEFKN